MHLQARVLLGEGFDQSQKGVSDVGKVSQVLRCVAEWPILFDQNEHNLRVRVRVVSVYIDTYKHTCHNQDRNGPKKCACR